MSCYGELKMAYEELQKAVAANDAEAIAYWRAEIAALRAIIRSDE